MMKSNSKLLLIVGLLTAFVFVLVFFLMPKSTARTDLGPFAKCISDTGAKFYGTFWCPHCQNQKKMFGTAKSDLPYVECSTADGKGQLSICTEAGIESYPTWKFSDGSILTGEVALEDLASKTNCSLPVKE